MTRDKLLGAIESLEQHIGVVLHSRKEADMRLVQLEEDLSLLRALAADFAKSQDRELAMDNMLRVFKETGVWRP